MMALRSRVGIVLLTIVVVSFLLPLNAQALPEVTIGVVRSGSTGLPPFIIDHERLDEKNGIKIKWEKLVSPPAVMTAFALGKFPLCTCSADHIVRMINNGRDVRMVFGVLRMHMGVIVRKDAPYKSLADLRGKKFGIFSWSVASTATLVSIFKHSFGLDMHKDIAVKVVRVPALAGLLEKGELEAIHIFEPIILKLLLSGKFRQLAATRDEWKKISGGELLLAGIGADMNWARNHGDTLRRTLKTYQDAFERIRTNPDLFVDTGFITSLGLKPTAKVKKIVRERMTPIYLKTFDEKLVQAQSKFFEELVANHIVKKAVKDWYTLEYAPR